jgi:hypothetical protein
MPRCSPSEAGKLSAGDVAAYVETIARELKGLVDPHDMSTLAYLLELVRLEAATCAKAAPSSSVEAPSLDQ